MDRCFLCKELFQWLNYNNFDWVTKCKRNIALYQRNGSDWKGNPRYSPVKPSQLLVLYYPQLIKAGECSFLNIPNVYIKLPVMKANIKGVLVKKQDYIKVAIVATTRLL